MVKYSYTLSGPSITLTVMSSKIFLTTRPLNVCTQSYNINLWKAYVIHLLCSTLSKTRNHSFEIEWQSTRISAPKGHRPIHWQNGSLLLKSVSDFTGLSRRSSKDSSHCNISLKVTAIVYVHVDTSEQTRCPSKYIRWTRKEQNQLYKIVY